MMLYRNSDRNDQNRDAMTGQPSQDREKAQGGDGDAPPRELSPAAKRALAEAEARRKAAQDEARPRELGGREGPEPTRYGDWEKGGIVSDF
jgi:hypothetical protein